MGKHCYRDKNFRTDSWTLIHTAEDIIDKYTGMGLRLTLRQLYYQFVAHHGLPNTERSYKNLASLISDARLAGHIDWEAIEDRGREPSVWRSYESPSDVLHDGSRMYRLDRWEGQPKYAELWVEKQALAGVLEPLAMKHHVTLMVNKGYSSQSAMYESAQRFIEGIEKAGDHEGVLYYLGDHDPSGEDMVRDIEERMVMFEVENLTVVKVALTMDQIRKHKPPPNPAKITDPRAAAYIRKHGRHSWEVDALDPDQLAKLIDAEFKAIIDKDQLDEVKAREQKHRDKLSEIADETDWDA